MNQSILEGDMKKEEIMVSVTVCTYNQEQWIRQTLDSIIAQEAQHTYEIIIGEDHGTDGTRAICQEYVERAEKGEWKIKNPSLQCIRLMPSEENLGIVANSINCILNSRGKYIMGCGGDDYWHNPHKLQLQVDFMEAHPDCVLCHTDYDILYNKTGQIQHQVNESNGIQPPQGRIQKVILQGNSYISAVTTCYRAAALKEYVPNEEFAKRRFPREDWPTHLILAAHGDFLYIPISTATYRVGQESITRTSNYEKVIIRAQQDMEMTKYLYTLFPEWGSFEDEPYFAAVGYHNAMHAAYRNNDYSAAHEFAKKAFPNKWATRFARTKLTFKIFRWIQIKRKRL